MKLNKHTLFCSTSRNSKIDDNIDEYEYLYIKAGHEMLWYYDHKSPPFRTWGLPKNIELAHWAEELFYEIK